MKLIEVNKLEKDEYDSFVAAQTSGSFLQSWGWGVWQEKLGHRVFRYWILDDIGNKIGSVQFVKMPLFAGKCYLYAPYGPVLAEGEKVQYPIFNIQSLTRELKKQYRGLMFIRIEPIDGSVVSSQLSVLRKSTNIQPAITMVADVTKGDEELLAAMHPKTRYNIKVAQKHGVKVEFLEVGPEFNPIQAKDVVDRVLETQERQSYRGHSREYYYKLFECIGSFGDRSALKIRLYKATYQNKVNASGVMVDFGRTRMYLYGGSSDENRNVMAPYLMHWQAMQDATALGMSIYDFGGSEVASGGEKGFTRFKQGFGGRVVNYAGAYDIIIEALWYNIYKGLRVINRLLKQK